MHDLVLKKCWWLLWWLSNVFCLYLRLLTNESATTGVESSLQVNVAEVKENNQLSITSIILNYIHVYDDSRRGVNIPILQMRIASHEVVKKHLLFIF